MTIGPHEHERRLQTRLRWALWTSIVVSVVLRLTAPGWGLIVFGIVLLVIVLLHLVIQNYAISKIPETTGEYAWLIGASDLFLCLAFLLQADGGDTPEMRVPLLFWRSFDFSAMPKSFWNTLGSIDQLALIALPLSWLLLLVLRKNVFKKVLPA